MAAPDKHSADYYPEPTAAPPWGFTPGTWRVVLRHGRFTLDRRTPDGESGLENPLAVGLYRISAWSVVEDDSVDACAWYVAFWPTGRRLPAEPEFKLLRETLSEIGYIAPEAAGFQLLPLSSDAAEQIAPARGQITEVEDKRHGKACVLRVGEWAA